MKKEEFFEVLGELDNDIVKGAKTPMKKKLNWKVWGTMAACLCLAVSVAAAAQVLNRPQQPVKGGDALGAIGETGEYSIAIYPDGEDVKNVETATCVMIDEAAAYAMEGLGEHLPTWLPDGISFHNASLYETTMKDGTKYYLLRAFYTTGEVIPSNVVDGETGELLPDILHDEFAVFVMNCPPTTKRSIHQMEDLPEFLSNTWDGGTFHFQCGDVYIGFTPNGPELSVDEILSVIASIT